MAFDAASVRRDFLEFFAERGHRIVPSAPVFPKDDPTLLFTNAGMNQFKDVFLGTGKRDYTRAVDTQKCIRVSGKHNDLEEVGADTYHHTFFEMLGNWSFGDYFKAEAIEWAWELLTEVWGLPAERLWVTVFAGDPESGLPPDEEAERLWIERTGIAPERVLRFDRKDNFWEMGETGPCGPCTEIHIDRGGPQTDPADGADPRIGVNAGNERFIELWNLVFIEFNRLENGSLQPLPAKHVDTGMGFERILSVLQKKRSNYDTDLFAPLFRRIEELSGRRYGESETADVAIRVCADHMRAVTSAIADGAAPSNTGRGYVLRRLIRRAARFGRQALDVEEPFLFEIAPAIAEVLGDTFPEMRERLEHVRLVVREEEVAFGRTLGRGLVRFGELADRVERSDRRTLPGAEAFELYATYGFPRDLVELMARERGLGLDEAGWSEAEQAHRAASRSEGTFRQLLSAEELASLEASGGTVSTYHEEGESAVRLESEVLLAEPHAPLGEAGVKLVLRESPFYPEAGGQIGDSGTIERIAGDGPPFRVAVEDTQRIGSVVVHLGRALEGRPETGARVLATVDAGRRARTRRHHTATHLLHKALREVLGEHVVQQGSYVGPDRLRFDFSNPRGLSPEELERVEALVNEHIFENARVATTIEELEAAKARGVTALFGEKYDERVRVVAVGDWSAELCGGTHVRAAGDIGPFLILSERAIQAGVRRIEAVAGEAAIEEIQRGRRLLREASQRLKTAPEELPERIGALQTQLKEAKKKRRAGAGADVAAELARVEAALEEHDGVRTAAVRLRGLDTEALRELAGKAKALAPDLALVLVCEEGDKVPFLVLCQGAARERGLAAGAIAKQLGARLGGGGGGRPELAQGQGTRAEAIDEALEWASRELAQALAAR